MRKLLLINPEQCVEVPFDQQVTIGRDVYNSLCLKDPELSRSHAIIFEQDGETVIKDLRSRNGVYVRGEKVQEGTLQPNDEIIVGATVMIFDPNEALDLEKALTKRGRYLIERRGGKISSSIAEPENLYTTAEMEKSIEMLFGNPDGSNTFPAASALALLLSVKEMDAAQDNAALFEATLRRALSVLGGHRGVIMECIDGKENLKVRSIISADNTDAILIAQPVLKMLLGSEKCVVCPDIKKNKRYENMAAKCKRTIHSFVAVPIKNGAELFGLIYLDSEDKSVSYDFPALRTLYFIAYHMGALLRPRTKPHVKTGSAAAVYRVTS